MVTGGGGGRKMTRIGKCLWGKYAKALVLRHIHSSRRVVATGGESALRRG